MQTTYQKKLLKNPTTMQKCLLMTPLLFAMLLIWTSWQWSCNTCATIWATGPRKIGSSFTLKRQKFWFYRPKHLFTVQDITMDDRFLGSFGYNKLSAQMKQAHWQHNQAIQHNKSSIKVKKLKRMRSVGSGTMSEFYYKAIFLQWLNISVWGSCSDASKKLIGTQ